MKNLSPINEDKDVVTKEYVDPIKSQAAINKATLGTQCKNLLKHSATTQTINGVTFTVNSDGTITASGTATANAFFKFATLTLKSGTYKYSGISITPSTSTANMSVFRMSDWVGLCALAEKDTFTITADTKIECRAIIYSGYTANNVVFYPMIRYADITDGSYEPYSDNVDTRLIKNKSDIAVNKSTLGYQRKNQLNETGYLSSITSVTRGTKSISGNQITLTATADNCFTNPHTSSDGGYRIPVEPDTDYILSWESDNTYAGLVYIFMNGNTSNYKNANNKVSKYIKFTTNSDTTFITIRLAVATSGNSITYSNIMLRYADILDDTYEPYQPSVLNRCLLKDTAGIVLGVAQSSSITIDNLPAYTALWVNVSGNVSGINFKTNLIVPIAYLAKSTSNRVQLAGGIPSSAYITSEGVLAAKHMDGTITAKVSGNTLNLTIGTGTIGSIEVVSLM